jgi:ferredoxin
MGCGVCVAHCLQEAIDLTREPTKGEPLEIRELMVRAAK